VGRAAGRPVRGGGARVRGPVSAGRLAAGRDRDALYQVDWVTVPAGPATAAGAWAVVGADRLGLGDVDGFADLDALGAAVSAGRAVPDVVLAPCTSVADDDLAGSVRDATHRALA